MTALTVERIFNAPVEKVWAALTDRDNLSQWFFHISEFRPEVGFEFQFIGGKDDVSYLVMCKVTEVVIGRKFSYSWRYEGFRGNSMVTFELFAEGAMTKLRLTHEGLQTFPMSKPDFINGYYVPDWQVMIGKSLTTFVEKINH